MCGFVDVIVVRDNRELLEIAGLTEKI